MINLWDYLDYAKKRVETQEDLIFNLQMYYKYKELMAPRMNGQLKPANQGQNMEIRHVNGREMN